MRPTPSKETEYHGAPPDDQSIQQHIRLLAVSLNPDGLAPLKRPSVSAARAPASKKHPLSAAPEWAPEDGRMTESLIRSLCRPGPEKLPSCGGVPRILLFARELVHRSFGAVSSELLIDCLRAFDEVRALRMAELWAAPSALATALSEEYIRLTARAARTQRTPDASPHPAAPSAQTASGQAHDSMLLNSLLTSLRMLNLLDWSECFSRVSRIEQTLLSDPAGTYPAMSPESRAQIRSRTSYLAKRCGVSESAVASCALEAAAESEDIRREICWWLHTDEGTRALLDKMNLRLSVPRLIPDPRGTKYILSVLALTCLLFLTMLCAWSTAAAVIGLPVLWGVSASAVNAVLSRLVRPHPLLRLDMQSIPDECRTLVVLPALLSSPERAQELAGQLETLGCLERDKNLSFLLLGDLPDHDAPAREGDPEIILAAQSAIDAANRRAGTEKYHFLHRERVLQPCEGRFMGKERKRGALTALNRLLLTGESEFFQSTAHTLTGRFAFVLTLDAGTRMLPGTAHRLVGTLAHPLNRLHRSPGGEMRGYALLAPRMELPADAVSNRLIELYGGPGGVDSYPTSVSDVYQDFCGQGVFGGKGIYDVAAFDRALSGKLPDNAILSHDLIEGLLARAGFLGNVALYDGHPRTVRSYLMRLNRWTRGDWQLLPLLFRLPLSALDRYKIIDNLRRSLEPVSQMLLLYLGYYARSLPILLLSLAPILLPMLLYPSWNKRRWMQALARFSLLPQEVFFLVSAIVRALWRMTVSHKRLLQWVTADDADRSSSPLSPAPGWIASALLLPALVAPAPWLLTDVLLAALWWTGASLAESLEVPFEENLSFDPDDRALLHDLAARTFRFFSENTSETGLPPDNVQLDPPTGAAMRTSPTNIGLYLTACVSARELGVISAEELIARASQTLHSLERMEKWHGQLYNWYHPETLEPLRPRYVSSVDSGNLAACLLLTARALSREGSAEPARRMEELVRRMDFTPLFDRKRKLFFIGMDAETNRLSASHYDLLASESRILSFTALMLGQIPLSHWAHLGRAVFPVGKDAALLSWSGTMFEYLMPDLFLPSFRSTLLGQTREAVISAQRAQTVHIPEGSMPWGVSESCFWAFDAGQNYQYRAFGLPALALRADADDRVIAPYASLLALPFCPDETISNLRKMISLGFMDEQGLFEAVDCAPERMPPGDSMRIVRSHMAHHQGMILCSLCNALTDGALVRLFCDRPEAKALLLLLQEKPVSRVPSSLRRETIPHPGPKTDSGRTAWEPEKEPDLSCRPARP